MTQPDHHALFVELMNTEGKGELVGGRVVSFPLLTVYEARVARRLLRSLEDHAQLTGEGEACLGNIGFILTEPLPSGRQSFCPNVSFLDNPPTMGSCGFAVGAPTFAVEFVRPSGFANYNDPEMQQRIEDYFAAGSRVVWLLTARRRVFTPSNQTLVARPDSSGEMSQTPNLLCPAGVWQLIRCSREALDSGAAEGRYSLTPR